MFTIDLDNRDRYARTDKGYCIEIAVHLSIPELLNKNFTAITYERDGIARVGLVALPTVIAAVHHPDGRVMVAAAPGDVLVIDRVRYVITPIFMDRYNGKLIPEDLSYEVGDTVVYEVGQTAAAVVVAEKEADVKNGEPGFIGYSASRDDIDLTYPSGADSWGYDRQIVAVVRTYRSPVS